MTGMPMPYSSLKDAARPASHWLKTLGNERRLTILCLLAERERSVGELERLMDLSQSALSQHLARLRQDGFVATRRDAQTVYYSLRDDRVTAIMGTLDELFEDQETGADGSPDADTPRRQ